MEFDNDMPIGVFDSGIGGVTVLYEIAKQMPNENIIYLADDKNCPYGIKTTSEIIELSKKNTQFLLDKGAKMVIVACNTATMAAVSTLRDSYNISFVAIEPAIKPATSQSKSGVIGVIATKSSIESNQLKSLCEKYSYDKIIVRQAGIGLVDMIENNKLESQECYQLLEKYLQPMIDSGIDHIVLGCTHYPFLINNVKKIIGKKNIKIVNPASAVARQVKRVLERENLLTNNQNEGNITFYSTKENGVSSRIEDRYIQYQQIKKSNNISR